MSDIQLAYFGRVETLPEIADRILVKLAKIYDPEQTTPSQFINSVDGFDNAFQRICVRLYEAGLGDVADDIARRHPAYPAE